MITAKLKNFGYMHKNILSVTAGFISVQDGLKGAMKHITSKNIYTCTSYS